LIQAVIALVWAVEPSPFSVPVEQVGAAPAVLAEADAEVEVVAGVELPPAVVEVDEPPVLLLLQAASAAVATSTPAARPARLSFTIGSPSSIDLSSQDARSGKWRIGVARVNDG
jgi:hypothetical protein